mgnify:CR=1 FL=1|tara:strand:- start:1761 stop:2018 length:258 start_codon:yes stop_codon:yes gene_type:complete
MRFGSVKHAEFEIIKAISECGYNPDRQFSVTLREIKEKGVPEGDKVAEKRFHKAALNIGNTFKNKMESRRKYLPKNHPEYTGDVE